MMRSDRATENLGHTPISGSLAREEFKSTESDTIRMPADVVGKLIVLGVVLLFSFSAPAADQEGYHGHGHGQWHAQFYSGLMRPDTKTPCCNLPDCRPTEIRSTNDHYEIKKDGRWIPCRSTRSSR